MLLCLDLLWVVVKAGGELVELLMSNRVLRGSGSFESTACQLRRIGDHHDCVILQTSQSGRLHTVNQTDTGPIRTYVSVLWLGAAVVFFVCEAVAAAAVPLPGFSYATNLISELGVPEWSPLSAVMNAGLLLQGLLFLDGRCASYAHSPRVVAVDYFWLSSLLSALWPFSWPLSTAIPQLLVTIEAAPSIGTERSSRWWAATRRSSRDRQ